MLGAGGYSLAPLEYKTFASHCWLKAWPNATKYALALLCHASTLHTNCLAKAADKLAAVDAVKSLHGARCRSATWHRVGVGGILVETQQLPVGFAGGGAFDECVGERAPAVDRRITLAPVSEQYRLRNSRQFCL